MRRLMIASMMSCIALAGLPMLGGCDETIEHKKEVEVKKDGTTVEKEKTVTQDKDTGQTKTTEEKKVDKP
jgi:hypothetical protein